MLRNLDRPPTPNYLSYLQADYIEFLCLIHPDRSITDSEIRSRILTDADINDENDYDSLSRSIPENSDKQLQRAYEWFQHMKHREQVLLGAYPFCLNSRSSQIELKEELTNHQKLYVYLLMASCLRHYDKSASYHLSHNFESICAHVLRQYIGENGIVRIFGTSSSCHYSGTAYSRITQLAQDLGESLRMTEDQYNGRFSRDEGLDVVGWLPIYDDAPGRLLVFGQCACTTEWEGKQHETAYEKWNQIMSLTARPVNAIFIPFYFRDIGGQWYASLDIHGTLLLDRLRILTLLRSDAYPLGCLGEDVLALIEKTLSYIDDF